MILGKWLNLSWLEFQTHTQLTRMVCKIGWMSTCFPYNSKILLFLIQLEMRNHRRFLSMRIFISTITTLSLLGCSYLLMLLLLPLYDCSEGTVASSSSRCSQGVGHIIIIISLYYQKRGNYQVFVFESDPKLVWFPHVISHWCGSWTICPECGQQVSADILMATLYFRDLWEGL